MWNTLFPSSFVERVAERRESLCRSNACGLYDKTGTSPAAVIIGKPACAGCGCNIKVKTHSLSSWCYLKDIDRDPLWEAEMSIQEEEEFRNKTGLKNDE